MGEKPKKPQQVYTLLVQVGRKSGDGLPDGASGAGLMIYASGVDEAEAVRESVAVLKQADLARWMSPAMARWPSVRPRAMRSTGMNARLCSGLWMKTRSLSHR